MFEYVRDVKTGKLYVENGKWVAKSDKPIILPKEKYRRVERDGVPFMVCTLRQKALQTIGLDSTNPDGKNISETEKNFTNLIEITIREKIKIWNVW